MSCDFLKVDREGNCCLIGDGCAAMRVDLDELCVEACTLRHNDATGDVEGMTSKGECTICARGGDVPV